ncbi:MAG: hypothetical protein JWN41_1435 [Thermoleophilia bacterium]|nr:hypothetical protein [Thermoleophilia bacterium]
MAEATRDLAARTEPEPEGEDTLAHEAAADGRQTSDSRMAQQGHPDAQEPVARDARDMNDGGHKSD